MNADLLHFHSNKKGYKKCRTHLLEWKNCLCNVCWSVKERKNGAWANKSRNQKRDTCNIVRPFSVELLYLQTQNAQKIILLQELPIWCCLCHPIDSSPFQIGFNISPWLRAIVSCSYWPLELCIRGLVSAILTLFLSLRILKHTVDILTFFVVANAAKSKKP